MGLFQRFQCARGQHRRDRRTVWVEDRTFFSRCTGCGREMTRGLDGWRLIDEARTDPLALPVLGYERLNIN